MENMKKQTTKQDLFEIEKINLDEIRLKIYVTDEIKNKIYNTYNAMKAGECFTIDKKICGAPHLRLLLKGEFERKKVRLQFLGNKTGLPDKEHTHIRIIRIKD
jgi:hypothetical protein